MAGRNRRDRGQPHTEASRRPVQSGGQGKDSVYGRRTFVRVTIRQLAAGLEDSCGQKNSYERVWDGCAC